MDIHQTASEINLVPVQQPAYIVLVVVDGMSRDVSPVLHDRGCIGIRQAGSGHLVIDAVGENPTTQHFQRSVSPTHHRLKLLDEQCIPRSPRVTPSFIEDVLVPD